MKYNFTINNKSVSIDSTIANCKTRFDVPTAKVFRTIVAEYYDGTVKMLNDRKALEKSLNTRKSMLSEDKKTLDRMLRHDETLHTSYTIDTLITSISQNETEIESQRTALEKSLEVEKTRVSKFEDICATIYDEYKKGTVNYKFALANLYAKNGIQPTRELVTASMLSYDGKNRSSKILDGENQLGAWSKSQFITKQCARIRDTFNALDPNFKTLVSKRTFDIFRANKEARESRNAQRQTKVESLNK